MDWAADNQPYSTGPTFKISRATNGKSVLAEEKKVAKKSNSMLDKMIGRFQINFTPSVSEVMVNAFCLLRALGCGTGPIKSRAARTARKETALIRYTAYWPI